MRYWVKQIVPVSLLLMGQSLLAGSPPSTAICFHPNSQSVLVAAGRELRQYEWPSLELIQTRDVEIPKIHDLQFSDNGKFLAIAGGEPGVTGIVQFLDSGKLVLLQRRQSHADSIYSLAWLSKNKYVTTSLDGNVQVNSLDEQHRPREFKGHSKGVLASAFHSEKNLLVTAGLDRNLRVWNTETGELEQTLNQHTNSVVGLAFQPTADGLPLLASISQDRTLRFWQPSIGRLVRFHRLEEEPTALAWRPHSTTVVVATKSGEILKVDSQTLTQTSLAELKNIWLHDWAISPDGNHVVVASNNGLMKIHIKD